MTTLHTIIYLSSATEIIDVEIARQSIIRNREYNKLNGITSLAVFAQGNILAMMEGERDVILKAYRQNMNGHHHGFLKLYDKPVQSRCFEDFPLAIKVVNMDEWRSLDDFKEEYMREYFEECINLDAPTMKIVKDFIKNNV
ncbi:MAG: BLUF domain-containing protein [Sphingobacteriaceae bacterium]|nr:BLUF domain-containing protein [Sphingobacteriaceae bacterium]